MASLTFKNFIFFWGLDAARADLVQMLYSCLEAKHVGAYLMDQLKKKCHIKKTYPCNVNPLEPHFYIAKLGYAGVYLFFLIFAPKHRLWVHVRTASPRRF